MFSNLISAVAIVLCTCTCDSHAHNKKNTKKCLTNLIFFCDLKPNAKFKNPKITLSGRKVMQAEERDKNAVNSGHLVL